MRTATLNTNMVDLFYFFSFFLALRVLLDTFWQSQAITVFKSEKARGKIKG